MIALFRGVPLKGFRRPPAGLRIRLAAAFALVALLASVIASGVAYLLVRRAMLQRTQDAVLSEFRSTLSRTVPAQLPPEPTTLAKEIEDTLASRPGRRAYVTERPPGSGWPYGRTPGERLGVPVSRTFWTKAETGTVFQRISISGRPFLLVGARVYARSGAAEGSPRERPQDVVDPRQRGVQQTRIIAFYAVSLQREAADLRTFTSAVLIADVLALGPALVLALLAARGVLRPVRELGGAARALGEGRLETRVRVRGGDELADLATTFNDTADVLERMVAELSAMEAASRRFVADVSHELRTPLTTMIAVTDVLAEETAASADGGTAARLVVAETHRLRQLVEHLIEISRFDAGAADLVLDDIMVADAVAATLAARTWTERVEVAGPAGLAARLDPRRFDVIVANLVGNALEHGEPPVRLRFGPAGRAGLPGVELVVTDRGPGIPGPLLGLVFDRFVKADAARSRSAGSGLGLSIARENAILHGGTLEAANRADGGAAFTLWLPRDREEPRQ